MINAYLGPILKRYFESLRHHLAAIGVTAPMQVMKSDGGIMTVAAAIEKPAYIVESGPAAGVIGAAAVSQFASVSECITLDMGGTTAKASIVESGRVSRTSDYEVGAGINLSSKLVMGGGYALKMPVIDVSEIGAGGGSLVGVDAGGLLRVGPKSAGSLPGPVAYGLGGEQADLHRRGADARLSQPGLSGRRWTAAPSGCGARRRSASWRKRSASPRWRPPTASLRSPVER